MTISKAEPIQIMGRPNPEEKRRAPFKDTVSKRPTLKELQEKKYLFPDSDLLGMPDDLLENGVIKLSEPKRAKEVRRTAHPKYCHYHRMVGHPL